VPVSGERRRRDYLVGHKESDSAHEEGRVEFKNDGPIGKSYSLKGKKRDLVCHRKMSPGSHDPRKKTG